MPEAFPIADQIRAHILANSIISRYNTNDPILDSSELVLLQRFSTDRSASNRDAIPSERNVVDDPGTRPGEKAAVKEGSLVGLLVAR